MPGETVGHLADISFGGFKMLSKAPIETNTAYRLEISLPENYIFQKSFTVLARSCWCKTDINPDYFASGFCFIDLSLENFRLVKTLMLQYGLSSAATGVS